MKTIGVGMFLLFIAMTAKADVVETAFFTIDKIRISENSGKAYIDPVGNIETLNSTCTGPALYGFLKEDELFNQLYSTALTAAVSGREVRVWISDVANDCAGTYQRIRLIEMD